jgi:hypothetical protein
MFLEKISVRDIVADHADTLRDYGTGRISVADALLFFGIPIAIGVAAIWAGIRIRVSAVSAILTASAIFIGLLPNLLILVLTFLMNLKGDPSDQALRTRKQLMREITAHVSFSFVLSLAVASAATTALLLLPDDNHPVGPALTFILVAGSVALLLALLMLIRRMHVLVVTEFDRHKFQHAA